MSRRKRTREQNEAAVARGDQAENDLRDTTILDAFRLIESEAIAACRQAVTPEQAHHAALMLQTSSKVLAIVRSFVADGRDAARAMAEELKAQDERRLSEYDHSNYLTAAREARSAFDTSGAATREEQPNV